METVTIEMIKADIAATYDVEPYIEWSKEAEQELEIAAYWNLFLEFLYVTKK